MILRISYHLVRSQVYRRSAPVLKGFKAYFGLISYLCLKIGIIDFSNKHIIILDPHTDDGELGCGATIHKAISVGAHVTYVAFSTVEESVPDGYPKNQLELELRKATASLGIKEENLIVFKYTVRKLNYVRQEILESLIQIRKERKIDMVFMPVLDDIHQDHSTIAAEGLRAFKNSSIFGYELMWNNIEFRTNGFISVSQENVDAKIKALRCYESQRNRKYMSAEFIQSLATVRGVQCGKDLAEAFEIIRWII